MILQLHLQPIFYCQNNECKWRPNCINFNLFLSIQRTLFSNSLLWKFTRASFIKIKFNFSTYAFQRTAEFLDESSISTMTRDNGYLDAYQFSSPCNIDPELHSSIGNFSNHTNWNRYEVLISTADSYFHSNLLKFIVWFISPYVDSSEWHFVPWWCFIHAHFCREYCFRSISCRLDLLMICRMIRNMNELNRMKIRSKAILGK